MSYLVHAVRMTCGLDVLFAAQSVSQLFDREWPVFVQSLPDVSSGICSKTVFNFLIESDQFLDKFYWMYLVAFVQILFSPFWFLLRRRLWLDSRRYRRHILWQSPAKTKILFSTVIIFGYCLLSTISEGRKNWQNRIFACARSVQCLVIPLDDDDGTVSFLHFCFSFIQIN